MNIENAQFTTADEDFIRAEINGAEMVIPTDVENRHYAEIIAQNIDVAAAEG